MTKPDTAVPLPDKGKTIRYRRKGTIDWKTGTVQVVWLCIEEAAIDVNGETIIPAFGDAWDYIEGHQGLLNGKD